MSTFVTVVLVIIVAGILLWVVKRYVNMDPALSNILTAVVVIGVVLYILKAFGLLSFIKHLTI